MTTTRARPTPATVETSTVESIRNDHSYLSLLDQQTSDSWDVVAYSIMIALFKNLYRMSVPTKFVSYTPGPADNLFIDQRELKVLKQL